MKLMPDGMGEWRMIAQLKDETCQRLVYSWQANSQPRRPCCTEKRLALRLFEIEHTVCQVE